MMQAKHICRRQCMSKVLALRSVPLLPAYTIFKFSKNNDGCTSLAAAAGVSDFGSAHSLDNYHWSYWDPWSKYRRHLWWRLHGWQGPGISTYSVINTIYGLQSKLWIEGDVTIWNASKVLLQSRVSSHIVTEGLDEEELSAVGAVKGCDETETDVVGNGEDYRGCQTVTRSGYTC